ncbi:MAG: hypothetical protein FWG30_09830 [Eubacteriaceae bacterium]|nr:hypothetical protein [Eubacteriaceae bacterium]
MNSENNESDIIFDIMLKAVMQEIVGENLKSGSFAPSKEHEEKVKAIFDAYRPKPAGQ